MSEFLNKDGKVIVEKLIKAIQDNKTYLSDIDGLIGDGDHGINMNKGFTMCAERLEDGMSLSESLKTLGRVLMMEIGGSMGPLYGTLFNKMARACKSEEAIGRDMFGKMLSDAVAGVSELGSAKVGDKTLMDVLIPADEAYKAAVAADKDFKASLEDMKAAAEKGWLSTKDLVAKIGRASRLGERSRGVLDAGATSCNLILQTMADAMIELM
ncbi:MAG: dihydroxyacetone kinase subunit L [Clostridia bacterium]|nr:dihydroxyacetone kinase subunit L [Clostridia bacterium]